MGWAPALPARCIRGFCVVGSRVCQEFLGLLILICQEDWVADFACAHGQKARFGFCFEGILRRMGKRERAPLGVYD